MKKVYNQLLEANKEEVRDTTEIARLFTLCTQVYGMKLSLLDFMGPSRPLDLSNEGKKDHCSSAA